MEIPTSIVDWLLDGDPSICFQVYRDLLGEDRRDLQNQIEKNGWAKIILDARQPNKHWGQSFYQPKWISTHYTLLDLKLLGLSPDHPVPQETIHMVLNDGLAEDGGIPLGPSTLLHSDVCVNAMFLNYSSYFGVEEEMLEPIVDSILREIMPDGGFNCRSTRSGAKHSSLHTTISVLEGLLEFRKAGYSYRQEDITTAVRTSEEFVLKHQLFLSDRTGEIIKKEFLKLSFPGRWKFNILRGLDYFQAANRPWDDRMQAAIDVLISKQNKNGTWNLQAAHPGQVHVIMEPAGKPSRWNTLRALRVLNHFNINAFQPLEAKKSLV